MPMRALRHDRGGEAGHGGWGGNKLRRACLALPCLYDSLPSFCTLQASAATQTHPTPAPVRAVGHDDHSVRGGVVGSPAGPQVGLG